MGVTDVIFLLAFVLPFGVAIWSGAIWVIVMLVDALKDRNRGHR